MKKALKLHFFNHFTFSPASPMAAMMLLRYTATDAKGQLISKANCQAVNSSKNRTNEFVITTMGRVIIIFLKKLKTTKKSFEII